MPLAIFKKIKYLMWFGMISYWMACYDTLGESTSFTEEIQILAIKNSDLPVKCLF